MRKLILILPIAAIFTGCMSPSPGGKASSSPGTGTILAAGGGAAVGGLVGKQLGGDKGAIIGAAGGAIVGAVGQHLTAEYYNNQLEEAKAQGAREERLKIAQKTMQDRYGKTAGQTGGATSGSESNSAKLEYPPGVYDGVLYGPRTQEVPAQ